MWSKEHGIVVSEMEIAENKRRKDKYGYAPDLYCEHCHGLGFVYPLYAGTVRWGEAMPCPICMTDQYHNYWNSRYSQNNPQESEVAYSNSRR